MSVFEINEIREHILSFVYPKKVTKGMWIKVLRSKFINKNFINNNYSDNAVQIFKIVKHINASYTVIIKYGSKESVYDNRWYCVHSYLYPNHGDEIKVVKSN